MLLDVFANICCRCILLLENVAIAVFGGRSKSFYTPAVFTHVIKTGELSIPQLGIIIPIVTAIILIILVYLVNHTVMGMSMRACARDVTQLGLWVSM